jgi:hypothetical protein
MECWAEENQKTNQKAREKNGLVKALGRLPIDGWKDFWASYREPNADNLAEPVRKKDQGRPSGL